MNEPRGSLVVLPAATRPAAVPAVPALSLWVERQAPRILAACMAIYVVVVFAASAFKYAHFGQGYDQVDFEQAIWNTVQGRPFADSRFNFTTSAFGMDWMPLLAVFVPVYALLPSALTLFFLQIVAAAVGAWPVYALARDALGTGRHGIVFGLLWLLFPTVEYAALDPFQVRIFAAVLLLFALLFFTRGRFGPFLGCAGVALLARTDIALFVIMFGVYALLARRSRRWVLAPLLLGGGYFLLVMTFVVPAFVHLPAITCTGPVPPDRIATAWPGSSNPNLGYYLQWGCTPGMIFVNLVKDPLYTLQYMFGDIHKLGYLAALLAPLAFLPLLAPGRLLLALPILGLNLIAWRTAQTDYRNHYQLLIVVAAVGAAVAGYAALERRLAHRRRALPGGWRDGLLAAVLVVAVAVNVLLHNPVLSVFLYHESDARVAAAARLVAAVPPDAQVAASSFLAPHLLPRRYLYNFPPASYSPYTMTDFQGLDYILVDPVASALGSDKLPDGRTALQALDSSPEWILLREDQGFRLYRRAHPAGGG